MDNNRKYYSPPPSNQQTGRIKKVIAAVFLILGIVSAAFVGYFLFRSFNPVPAVDEPPPVSEPEPESSSAPVPEPGPDGEQVYEVGKLFITPERVVYNDGDLTLSVPKIGIANLPVLNLPNPEEDGEDAVNKKLNDGIGLFYCSQLPGTGNPNVSIAGHRDIYGSEFLNLNELTTGDRIYLEFNGRRFEYEYVDTIIIDPNDPPEVIWKPMMTKDYSAITLQTCDPIGIASHRMFVTGKLVAVENLNWE